MTLLLLLRNNGGAPPAPPAPPVSASGIVKVKYSALSGKKTRGGAFQTLNGYYCPRMKKE